MVSILAVEDNRPFLDALLEQLSGEPEFSVRGAVTLGAARDALMAGMPDVLLLDISLPDGDGRALCRELRDDGHHFPILMLTASDGEDDTIGGFKAGASDYIVKPLRVGELIARIRAHLAASRQRRDARVAIGGFSYHAMEKTLTHVASGKVLSLTEKESAILHALAEAKQEGGGCARDGRFIAKEELLKSIWGYGEGVTTHTLETHVYRLRRKIAEIDGEEILVTSRDGYGLKKD